MAQFNYTLPSGAKFQLDAPSNTTQAQADVIFYSQVAAGTFVGYKVGDKLTHPTEALNNFGITRLERGTAGVDDKTLLAVISGLPVVTTLPAVVKTTPVQNPIQQENYIQVTSNPEIGIISQKPSGIGELSPTQTQAVMAGLINTVGQAYNVITREKGVGMYGFNAQQLERVGYIKPGYAQMYCRIDPVTQQNPENFVSFMTSPTPWTGKDGVYVVENILGRQDLQNKIQQALMSQSYDTFVDLGMIKPVSTATTTPVAKAGTVYTATGEMVSAPAVSLATASPAVEVIPSSTAIGELTASLSNLGNDATAVYKAGVASSLSTGAVSFASSNGLQLAGLAAGLLGGPAAKLASSVASVVTGDIGALLANGSKFGTGLTTAWASGTSALNNLPSLSDLGSSATNALSNLGSSASAALSNLTGSLDGALAGITGSAMAQLGKASQFAAQFGDQLPPVVSGIQPAAGFSNTVDRATIDAAVTRVIGSAKIASPTYELPSAESLGAEADISQAQSILAQAGGMASALSSQAVGIVGQAQKSTSTVLAQAQSVGRNIF